MKEIKNSLTKQEADQVSGGSLIGAADGAGTVVDGLFRTINASGKGIDGVTRPSPKRAGGSDCFCNCRRM
ncbi:hypothetical protein [Vibrio splendidus]|uniref:hypothetical protein n=1 Tax=Vibrio splendidus TaxID=29497 RepID=UPI0034A0CFE7